MNEALRRALTSPPKPHKEMKLGKRKPKAIQKASPPKKRGRPKLVCSTIQEAIDTAATDAGRRASIIYVSC